MVLEDLEYPFLPRLQLDQVVQKVLRFRVDLEVLAVHLTQQVPFRQKVPLVQEDQALRVLQEVRKAHLVHSAQEAHLVLGNHLVRFLPFLQQDLVDQKVLVAHLVQGIQMGLMDQQVLKDLKVQPVHVDQGFLVALEDLSRLEDH